MNRLTKAIATITASAGLLTAIPAQAHLVTFGWKDNGNGSVTLFGEHWHGNLISAYSDNAGINVSSLDGTQSVTAQWSGVANDITASQLGLTGYQADPGNEGSGTYNDWMFTAPIQLGNGTYNFFTGPGCCVDTMTSPIPLTVTGITSVNDGLIGTGAVPEPGTWAMLLLGFFGVGLAMRSKRLTRSRSVQRFFA